MHALLLLCVLICFNCATAHSNQRRLVRNGIIRNLSGGFAVQRVHSADDTVAFLSTVQHEYGFTDPLHEFDYLRGIPTAVGVTHRLAQKHNNTPVFGRSFSIVTNQQGEVVSVTGNYLRDITPVNTVALTADEAGELVATSMHATVHGSTLVLYTLEHSAHLYAFKVTASAGRIATDFFIDAQTGTVIASLPLARHAFVSTPTTQVDMKGNTVPLNVEYDDEEELYYLADMNRNIIIADALNKTSEEEGFVAVPVSSENKEFTDPVGVSTLAAFVKSFDFYLDENNIGTTLSGVDGSVDSTVHKTTMEEMDEREEAILLVMIHYGYKYDNAAYASNEGQYNRFIIGDGDGEQQKVKDFAKGVDVIGHEYQHAVTRHAAGLIYLNASGAINEAFSDIFGALIEGYELTDERFWHMGEDVMIAASGLPSLRDMSDPTSMGYPDSVNSEYFAPFCYLDHNHQDEDSTCDNGGVHANNLILTYAAYRMYENNPMFFTKKVIGTLWYATLTLLQPDATFEDFREAMLTTARLLQYEDSVVEMMCGVFDDVGILGVCNVECTLPQYCKTCDVEGVCNSCADGRVLFDGACVQCTRSDPGCATCTVESNEIVCLACVEGYREETSGGVLACVRDTPDKSSSESSQVSSSVPTSSVSSESGKESSSSAILSTLTLVVAMVALFV